MNYCATYPSDKKHPKHVGACQTSEFGRNWFLEFLAFRMCRIKQFDLNAPLKVSRLIDPSSAEFLSFYAEPFLVKFSIPIPQSVPLPMKKFRYQ